MGALSYCRRFRLANRNLFDYRWEWAYPPADPGCYGAAAELGQFIVMGVSEKDPGAVGDRSGLEGQIRWAIATRRGDCLQWYRGHVIGDPNRAAFYRGADPQHIQVPNFYYEACGNVR